MFPVLRLIGNGFRVAGTSEIGLRMFGELAQRAGVTTSADLGNDPSDEGYATLAASPPKRRFRCAWCRARCPWTARVVTGACREAAQPHRRKPREAALRHRQAVRRRFDPGLLRAPALARATSTATRTASGTAHRTAARRHRLLPCAGLPLHIHTNGDEATRWRSTRCEAALASTRGRDHRHTLQHCQMADEALFRRMARLGVCANLFANHLYYWGDAHHDLTMGPDRAAAWTPRHRACAWRAAGDPFGCADHPARAAVHRVVRGQPGHFVGPGARRDRTHRGGRCAAHHHAGRGLHAGSRRPRSARSKSASWPTSACSTTTRPRSIR